MGGLDARYAISRRGLAERVACLTVETPHRGTPLADAFTGDVAGLLLRISRRIAGWFGVSSGAVDGLTEPAICKISTRPFPPYLPSTISASPARPRGAASAPSCLCG